MRADEGEEAQRGEPVGSAVEGASTPGRRTRGEEERERAREKGTEANEGSPASTCTVENAAFEDDSSKD